MESQMIIAVWIIAILVSFIPMPFEYKIIGIIVSVVLIAISTYISHRKNTLTPMTLIINLLIIGWDLAIVYMAVSAR